MGRRRRVDASLPKGKIVQGKRVDSLTRDAELLLGMLDSEAKIKDTPLPTKEEIKSARHPHRRW